MNRPFLIKHTKIYKQKIYGNRFRNTGKSTFFYNSGFSIQVNGSSVQVFEYNSAEDAEADASLVSSDGSSIGTSMPFWVDDPHFYYKEKIIVLYVGDDPAIEELLESVLGRQFAGR